MTSMKDKSHYLSHMKSQHFLLSAPAQKSQHSNWISLTKIEENPNKIESLGKQNQNSFKHLSVNS